jgi:hypothetical protein
MPDQDSTSHEAASQDRSDASPHFEVAVEHAPLVTNDTIAQARGPSNAAASGNFKLFRSKALLTLPVEVAEVQVVAVSDSQVTQEQIAQRERIAGYGQIVLSSFTAAVSGSLVSL